MRTTRRSVRVFSSGTIGAAINIGLAAHMPTPSSGDGLSDRVCAEYPRHATEDDIIYARAGPCPHLLACDYLFLLYPPARSPAPCSTVLRLLLWTTTARPMRACGVNADVQLRVKDSGRSVSLRCVIPGHGQVSLGKLIIWGGKADYTTCSCVSGPRISFIGWLPFRTGAAAAHVLAQPIFRISETGEKVTCHVNWHVTFCVVFGSHKIG